MSAFAQTVDGDLDISTGNLRIETNVAQVTAWKLTNLFSFFKGEWFRDIRQGVPYFQYVFVKNPSLPFISALFQKVVAQAPGAAGVTDMELNFLSGLRTLQCKITVQANDGSTIVGGPGAPFIVDNAPLAAQAGLA